jgi:hypothetical protein
MKKKGLLTVLFLFMATGLANAQLATVSSDDNTRTITVVHLGAAKLGAKQFKEQQPAVFGMQPMRYELLDVSLRPTGGKSDALAVGLAVSGGGDIKVLLENKCAVADSFGSKYPLLGAGTVASITNTVSLMTPTPGVLALYVPPDMIAGKTMMLIFPKPSSMSNLTLIGVEGFKGIALSQQRQSPSSKGK